MAKRFFLLVLTFLLFGYIPSGTKSNYTIPLRPASVYTDDIDLDGDMDIIVGHLNNIGDTGTAVSLLSNNGEGIFVIEDTSQVYLGYQWDILTAHINNDNFPDILTSFALEINDDIVQFMRVIYLNENGIESFNDFDIDNDDFSIDKLAVGDCNGNNYQDVIMTSTYFESLGILYNNGQGGLGEPFYINYMPHNDMAAGLINDDSLTDVVLCGATTEIFYSTGSGFNNQSIDHGSLKVLVDDMDIDSRNDIIGFDNIYVLSWIYFYENLGNEEFFQHDKLEITPGAYHFVSSDMNNDGLPEILCLLNSQEGIYILYNEGNFSFSEPVLVPIEYFGEDSRRMACDDLDGNGYNDIIVIRKHGSPLPSNMVILFNDGNGNFLEDPQTAIQTQEALVNDGLHCFPNPFSHYVSIHYRLEKPSDVQLSIFSANGMIIKQLVNEHKEKGQYEIVWNGNNVKNQQLPPGLYLVSLSVNNQILSTLKIIKK